MPALSKLVGPLLVFVAVGMLPAQGFPPSPSRGADRELPVAPFPGAPSYPADMSEPVLGVSHQEDARPKSREPNPGGSVVEPSGTTPSFPALGGDPPATRPPAPVRVAAEAEPIASGPRENRLASPATPLAPARRDAQVPLGVSQRSGQGESARPSGSLPALATVAGSLAVVLGLFFVFAWAMRRAGPRGSLLLPGEVFEVLGRAPLAGRQQVHLLRCGGKLLLVSISPGGAETLTEVADPFEVDRLAGLCRQAHPQSATAAFRQVFQQFAPKNPERKLFGARPSEEETRQWEEDHG